VGKTRLSLEAAARVSDNFQDGVFFVALAPVNDPSLVPATIAQALGVKETGKQPIQETLREYMRGKRMLLLLDNFEQVVEAAPVVAELLTSSQWLRVMTTSREPLHVRGERQFSVEPLELPDPDNLLPLEEMHHIPSVALFVERAQDTDPHFTLTEENVEDVAAICVRLDGIPLAIELLAAQSGLLSVHTLLKGLERVLTSRPGILRDLPPRHQTLRAAISWSYDLLNEGEKELLRFMSVFKGGYTLKALEAVCICVNRQSKMKVREGIESLLAKSLLQQRDGVDGESRFVMLESILEYAREKLGDSGEAEALQREHALYFMRLAEEAEATLRGTGQTGWFDRLGEEYDNFRAALGWSTNTGESEIALRLSGALWQFWQYWGYYDEGRNWLERAIGLPGDRGLIRARAGAFGAASTMAWFQGDLAAARSYAEQSVALAREITEPAVDATRNRALGYALITLANAAAFQGDFEVARSAGEESVARLRGTADRWSLAMSLLNVGIGASIQGDYTRAQAAFEESETLFRDVGATLGLAHALSSLGDIARVAGDHNRAKGLYEEGLDIYRNLGSFQDIPASIHNLGYVALALGDVERAKVLMVEALNLHHEQKNSPGVIECLGGLAGVAGTQKQPIQACHLFAAADALRKSLGVFMWPAERVDYERYLSATQTQLDGETWQDLWQEGRAMSLEQAIEYALKGVHEPRQAKT
jgi:predicted ATPase